MRRTIVRNHASISIGFLSVCCWWFQHVFLIVEAGPLHLNCDPCINRSSLEIHAVLHGTLDDPFWQQIEKAMQQAATDMGVTDFHVDLWETYASQAMADEIRSLIRFELDDSPHGHNHDVEQIDGLIVTMPDDIVRAAVADAIHAGIHVFGLNEGYSYASEMGLLGYVAQNEYSAGALAAREFERRRLAAYGNAKRALFVNHNENDQALQDRFRGFSDTLTRNQIKVDQVFVDPSTEIITAVQLHDIIEPCVYDYVLLGGSETVEAVAASFEYHKCGALLDDSLEKDVPDIVDIENSTFTDKDGPMMIGAFDGTEAIYRAIISENLAFTLTQENYLQGALPVVMATLYASTGQRLSLPSDRPVYNSGPHVVDRTNILSDTHLACEAEAFPICDNDQTEIETMGSCPCIDRSKLTIAGVIHGVEGDEFWDTVVEAAQQAALDMDVELDLTQFPPQESDEILHRKMSSKIISLCGGGVDGIFVTMPSEEVKDAVRFCKQLRIPVININAGYQFALELDVQHIGQLEYIAGMEAGDRMVIADVHKAYCLTPEPDNIALINRCEGVEAAMLQANITFGGIVEVPRDSQAQYIATVEEAVDDPEGNWDGIALVVNGDIEAALLLQLDHQSVALGTFDVRENLFEPLNDGRLLFTVDQQEYLQGSMSVYLLVYAAFADQTLINKAIETGPRLMEYAPNDQTCVENNYSVCPQIPEENYNLISDFWITVGYAAVGVVGGTGFLCLLWMLCYSNKNIVKASQPMFLALLVLGAYVSIFSILPQGVQTTYRYVQDPMTGKLTDEPNPDIEFVDIACMATPWFYGVGFVIMYSALCAKIHRVKMIYAAGARMRRIEVGVVDVLSVMGIMLALEVTLLLIWTLMYPSQWEREPTVEVLGYTLESVGRCTSEHHQKFVLSQLSFHAVCLVYAVLLCWQTSEIPTEFAEGSYIALSVLCIFQVAVLSIPIAYMVEDTPDVYYFVNGASIFLQTFTVLCLIFFPKMWRVATGNDELPLPSTRRGRSGAGSSAPTFRHDRPQPSIPSTVPAGNPSQFSKTASSLPPAHPSINDSFGRAAGASGSNNLANQNGNNMPPAVAKMAPLDSDSDSEDDNQQDRFAAKAVGAATIAGARNHLKAGLDSDSSASSSKDIPTTGAAIVGQDNQLADLSAELSRVEQARDGVYSSVTGKSAPEMHASKVLGANAIQFKRQDTPDSVSTSSDSLSLGPSAAKGPLVLSRMPGRKKKRYHNYGEKSHSQASVDATERTSQFSSLPAVHEPQNENNPQEGYGKNPQEGSQGSHDLVNKKEASSLDNESESTSTMTGTTTGITRAEASKAEIFRKSPPSTPIRLKKDPEAYGKNATLAMGITKARGSFLRRVAESYGSNSLSSSSTQSKSTSLEATPTRPPAQKHQPGAPLDKESIEFQVDRQSRPAFAALKRIKSTDEEPEVKTPPMVSMDKQPGEKTHVKKATDENLGASGTGKQVVEGGAFYFF